MQEHSHQIRSTARELTPQLATMEAFKLQKKYPEVSRDEMFDLINRFKFVLSFSYLPFSTSVFFSSSLRTESPGRVDKSEVLQALQASGQSYDVARETLKHVSVDASGKVELDDWVEVGPSACSRSVSEFAAQLNVKLKTQSKAAITSKAGKVTVQGSNANVSHTINEDERREFTNHLNLVCLFVRRVF